MPPLDWRDRPDPCFRADKNIQGMLRIIEDLDPGDGITSGLVQSLLSNLRGALDVAEMPATLIALPILWDRKSKTDRRTAIRPQDGAAHRPNLSKEGRWDVAMDRLAVTVASARPERDPDLIRCIETSLRQAVVLLWASVEIFSNDLAEMLLNSWPELISESEDEPARSVKRCFRSLHLGKTALNELRGSDRPGTLLLEIRRLQSLDSIRAFYSAIVGDSTDCLAALTSRELMELEQSRHLIVHKAGRVDRAFIRRTGSKQAPGEVIDVSPDRFKYVFSQSTLAALQVGTAVIRRIANRESADC